MFSEILEKTHWLPLPEVVLDLPAMVSLESVRLEIGTKFWKPTEDSSNCTSEPTNILVSQLSQLCIDAFAFISNSFSFWVKLGMELNYKLENGDAPR